MKITVIGRKCTPRDSFKERAQNMNDALDRCADSIVRQIRKNKTKVEKRLRSGAFEPFEAIDSFEPEENYDVVRSKEIVLKPQSVDEAILQMNLLDHQFYMFLNSANDKICVVYARKDGGYGLIIPEVD